MNGFVITLSTALDDCILEVVADDYEHAQATAEKYRTVLEKLGPKEGDTEYSEAFRDSVSAWLEPYGRDFASPTLLAIVQIRDGKPIDFSTYADEDGHWAKQR